MVCLFFDIASHCALFAVTSEDHVLALKEIDSVIRDHELPVLVEEVLGAARCSFEALTHIACVVGPDGFTSLRIAVTYANVLADQLGVLLAGICLADLYGARCTNDDSVWIHSTRREEVFIRGAVRKCGVWDWPEPVCVSLEEALEKMPESSRWCGELLPAHKKVLEGRGRDEAPLLSFREMLPQFLSTLEYGREQIAPWYGRDW